MGTGHDQTVGTAHNNTSVLLQQPPALAPHDKKGPEVPEIGEGAGAQWL